MTELPGRTPHTPIAVNIEMWFEGSFVERIEQAAALGFPAIELWSWRDKDLVAGAEALDVGRLGTSGIDPLDLLVSDPANQRIHLLEG